MKQKQSTITFCGGAGSVTGANFLFDTGGKKFLIDCGLTQEGGGPYRNGVDFLYDPKSIDALIITHAHADHIGKIPKLVKEGFVGAIYSTPATRDLSSVMFDDALRILTEEADDLGVEPLYERGDITHTMNLWRGIDYHQPFLLGDGVIAEFLDAGHILGSAMIQCDRDRRRIIFTGDLGNSPELILPDTEKIHNANYLLMESVYGDRNHENVRGRTEKLAEAIRDNYKRKGTLLIPTFALQRAQILLYEINKLVENGLVPEMPVYFDAPLAQRVTDIFRRYRVLYNNRVKEEIAAGDDIFDFPKFVSVKNISQSQAINKVKGPKIIIASSGMSNGGRIRLHEKSLLEKKNNTILFIGYQAFGTLGREIQEKKKKKVYIDGRWVRVKAQIISIRGYSGHKDSDHLIEFAGFSADTLEKIFVTMGEPSSSQFLARKIVEKYNIETIVPRKDDVEKILF
ncbi:MAG: MBL fold metallo-hydrolase [Candidatus Moraniibacteriota bacterium]|nr:MAG: MBL fold metallo-hydrolase [Candidatus Moranbacteria bacterium]